MRLLSILPLVLLLAACGGDDAANGGGDGAESSVDAGSASSEFDCSGETCSAGSEYCLRTTMNGVELTRECVELPEGCDSCSCAQDDAPNQFPTTNNCDFLITCSQSNEAITVECSQ